MSHPTHTAVEGSPNFPWFNCMNIGLERPIELVAGREYHIQLIVDDTIATLYVNGVNRIDRRQEDDNHQRNLEVAVDGDQTGQRAQPVRVHGVDGQSLDEHGADAVNADGGDERP